MPAYAQVTLAQARTQLRGMLDDTQTPNQFWVDAELDAYITEALRTWGAHTGYWRERVRLNAKAFTPFYDLTATGVVTPGPASLAPSPLALNVSDAEVFEVLQYSLLEPANAAIWTGTTQFTYAEVLSALQRRRDQFLIDTGIILTRTTDLPGYTIDGIVPLPATTLDIHRVAWIDVNRYRYPLWREDVWSMVNYDATYLTDLGTPQVYAFYNTETLTLQLAPPPLATGQLDLLTAESGAALNPAIPATLGIPDNLTWVVKWGALADLLSRDGEARDPSRAAYCLRRYQEGVDLANAYANSCIINLIIGNQASQVQSMLDMDTYDSAWQNKFGPPTTLLTASYNMVALSEIPTADTGTVVLDVVRNAPIPTDDSDYLQLTASDYNTVIEYARHLACFKTGGQEFTMTEPAHATLISEAGIYIARQKSMTRFYGTLNNLSRGDWSTRERERTEPALGGKGK